MINRFKCEDCWSIVTSDRLLRAESPFDPDDEIVGCPECKSIVGFISLCHETGCSEQASMGKSTEDGYVNSCHKHIHIVE